VEAETRPTYSIEREGSWHSLSRETGEQFCFLRVIQGMTSTLVPQAAEKVSLSSRPPDSTAGERTTDGASSRDSTPGTLGRQICRSGAAGRARRLRERPPQRRTLPPAAPPRRQLDRGAEDVRTARSKCPFPGERYGKFIISPPLSEREFLPGFD